MVSQNGIKRAGEQQARRHKPEKIHCTVNHWPTYHRESYYSLDPNLYPTEAHLNAWAHERFGAGRLTRLAERTYEFERDVRAPLLRRIGAFILNKSYQ